MPHVIMTLKEIAETFNIPVHTIVWWYRTQKHTFSTKHTHITKIDGKGQSQRVFTPLGVKRLEFLCKKAIKKAKKVDTTRAQLGIVAPPQKYPDIEKISKPKSEKTIWDGPLAPTLENVVKLSQSKTNAQFMTKGQDDDAVLDIAVKIIAERQAFNKIKEEITALREENEKLKADHLEMAQTLNLIGAAMFSWRQM